MRYGIFADIHSNLEAFEAVAEAYEKESIDAYFCCGDVVGYGADPHACIKIMTELRVVCVAGNHDWASADMFGAEHFNEHAKTAIQWTSIQLTDAERTFLKNLKFVERHHDLMVVHGSLKEPQAFHYLMDFSQMAPHFLLMDRAVSFVGHTHVPGIFVEDDRGEIKAHRDPRVDLHPKKRYLVNVGSVGQPRDGDPQAAYCIFDSKKNTIEIKRVAYDIKTAQDKILNAGLPARLAVRLGLGQ